MHLRYFPVRADLREFFGVYYVFETPTRAFQPLCAELGNLRFVLEGGGVTVWPNGSLRPVPDASVVGPTMSAYTIDAQAGTKVFGVGVLPYGWDVLFRFSAERLADQQEDLSAFMGTRALELLDRLRHARSDEERVAVADAYFGALLGSRKPRRRFPGELESWLLQPDVHGIDDLVEALDVSRRQVDRLAKYYFGASPKALQRKYRALHALTRISLDQPSHWFDASGEGFYDQSHFIKEFKQFVGSTPKAFMGEAAVLMSHSIKLRARATHKPPLELL
ncbi:MAG: helix-turn-helix domain-containing protein [Pseudomonadota bacterium]